MESLLFTCAWQQPAVRTKETATESTVTPPAEKGTSATDNMGDTNGNGNTVSENDSMLDNAGNAVDEAGDTVGNIVDDAANGISDITNDLVGNDNATTGTDQR